MPKYLKDLLEMNRYRLLYYFHRHKEVEDREGLKAKLRKLIGYSSDGHLYHDLEDLVSEGMIEKKGERWRITRQGDFEFVYLDRLKSFSRLLLGLAAYFSLFFWWGDITDFVVGVRIPGPHK